MSAKDVPDAGERVEQRVPERLLLNVRGVSELLGISERTVWKMASCRELLAPLRIGRSQRWSKKALEESGLPERLIVLSAFMAKSGACVLMLSGVQLGAGLGVRVRVGGTTMAFVFFVVTQPFSRAKTCLSPLSI